MNPKELLALGETIATLIGEATAPLLAKVAELEQRLAALPRGQTAAEVLTAVAMATKGLATEDDMRTTVGRAVSDLANQFAARIEALPTPNDGIDGKSVSVEDVRPVLAELVAALPRAKDGEPGRAASPEELRAAAEAALEPLIDRFALAFERRSAEVLLRLVANMPAPKDGKDGVPGKDGRDGIDFEGFEIEARDGGREIVYRLKRGELVVERSMRTATILDAGPFKDGTAYRAGDAVSFGGSLWIAQRDNTERPKDVGSDAWRCAVKRGRDGRDGKDGGPGSRGEKGEWGLSSFDTGIR